MTPIPVVVFAYARPDHLIRTLQCLREERVPLIYAFSDGPRTPEQAPQVARVRELLNGIDWCEIVICERETNMGLGRSILAGVTEVLQLHDSVIVFEDDLICVPGTYDYLSTALNRYGDSDHVMSVTGWTHPRITPQDVGEAPYFDGRAECWVWGTWRRGWNGMEIDAKTLMTECEGRGIDVYRYGADLVAMAETELVRNIWAVRFLYLHILKRGLCMRPPWSMVEHIGFDSLATNSTHETWLRNPDLKPCPPIPSVWKEPFEHPDCPRLHRAVAGERPIRRNQVTGVVRRMLRRIAGTASRGDLERKEESEGLTGDFASWNEAAKASTGYDSASILEKTRDALLKIKRGEAVFERDSVIFDEVQYSWPLLSGLMWAAAQSNGRLDVLDIGGSLGSTYYQNREFLAALTSMRWNIVEQPGHVVAGRDNFEDEHLHFYGTIDECLAHARPNVVLLSAVLQYLEDPESMLNNVASLSADFMIMERTPLWDGGIDRICVQTVPPRIYAASYPIWVFSKTRLLERLSTEWEVVAEFESLDRLPNPLNASWGGMILKRRRNG